LTDGEGGIYWAYIREAYKVVKMPSARAVACVPELIGPAQRLAEAAQDIAERLPQHLEQRQEALRVPFPTGVIRPLREHYHRWPYLSDERKRTVACVIQLCDVNRWLLNVWRIGLTAGTMWAWQCTLPVIAVLETLAYEFSRQMGFVAEGAKFKKVIDTLQSKGVVDANLRERLHDLREYRNTIHLYLHEDVGMHEGKPRRYNDAVRALRHLERALAAYGS
jgi:hypothetical protein